MQHHNLSATTTRKCTYVCPQSISSQLMCPICLDPLLDPVMCRSCRHTFCRSDVESLLETENVVKQCPMCRDQWQSTADLLSTPRLLHDVLDDLLVYCECSPSRSIRRNEWPQHNCVQFAEEAVIAAYEAEFALKVQQASTPPPDDSANGEIASSIAQNSFVKGAYGRWWDR
eukprot:Colp12_sorted_trinity150504_noHs@20099